MKQLCNVALMASLLGCTSPTENAEQLSADWEENYNQCIELEHASQDEFVTNNWFNSLSLEEKKAVALYVYQRNFYTCHNEKTINFESNLVELNAEKQLNYYRGIGAFDPPDESLISGIDKDEIESLVRIQPQSLNLRNLGRQLGFIK
ncbi:hypothetical protein [Vibrio bivalvicida]|uniref:Lipoprotein n=1 Tax=Vibrio bivalvicida TaxID=1276888 RepID=A0A177Y425_9VIBR|nr:hypothetical protein [Vibrio bivalvicida]OAJ95225.1 hypothetical protein APB76_08050 [Vibrio bivalvicida]